MSDKSGTGCVFCDKLQAGPEHDRENYILYRGPTCFALLNLYPYNNGHLMVVPNAHVANLEDLDADTRAELMTLTSQAVAATRQLMAPAGFNLGMNLGKVAGAGMAGHLHMHLVPRWDGDTNFMPLLAETRVIPEWLDQTYGQLRPVLEKVVRSQNSEVRIQETEGEGRGAGAGVE